MNCMENGKKMEEESHMIQGTKDHPLEAPNKSKINSHQKFPKLFDGMHFYLHAPSIGSKSKIAELGNIIKAGSGLVLTREPDPESIPDFRAPYHVNPMGPLRKCCFYILYQEGDKHEPECKFNMEHLKSLSLTWFYECVHNFSIVDPF